MIGYTFPGLQCSSERPASPPATAPSRRGCRRSPRSPAAAASASRRPSASASGIMPATVASAVIMIGRSRRSPAWIMLSSARHALGAEPLIGVEQQDAVLGDDADHHDQPHERRQVERGAGDQQREEHAEVESSADASTAIGAAKSPNSNSSTVNTSTTASTSTISQILETISAAPRRRRRTATRIAGGRLQIGDRPAAPSAMPSPRFDAFEARGHRARRAAGSRGGSRSGPGSPPSSASEPSVPVLPVRADQQRVLDGVERCARRLAGSARGWCRRGR